MRSDENISTNVDRNIQIFQKTYRDCADIKTKELYLGENNDKKCFLAYIEVALDINSFGESSIGTLVKNIEAGLSPNEAKVADVTEVTDIKEALREVRRNKPCYDNIAVDLWYNIKFLEVFSNERKSYSN